MTHQNLLLGATPPPTYLPENAEAAAALRDVGAKEAALRFPAYCAAWAELAAQALTGDLGTTDPVTGDPGTTDAVTGDPGTTDPVTAYAYARTGYHRGLDQLRRSGWRGNGPIPWEHEPNRGFLRALHLLGEAAAAIGEEDEAIRTREFLRDSSPAAAEALATDPS